MWFHETNLSERSILLTQNNCQLMGNNFFHEFVILLLQMRLSLNNIAPDVIQTDKISSLSYNAIL